MSNPFSTPDPGIEAQERAIERIGKGTETVYAHVERTVHALLDAIAAALPDAVSPTAEEGTVTPEGIKILAEAVQALASWKPPAWPSGYSLETSR